MTFFVYLQFYAVAWKVGGSSKLDQGSVPHKVRYHEHRRDTRHRQIHNPKPGKNIMSLDVVKCQLKHSSTD